MFQPRLPFLRRSLFCDERQRVRVEVVQYAEHEGLELAGGRERSVALALAAGDRVGEGGTLFAPWTVRVLRDLVWIEIGAVGDERDPRTIGAEPEDELHAEMRAALRCGLRVVHDDEAS